MSSNENVTSASMSSSSELVDIDESEIDEDDGDTSTTSKLETDGESTSDSTAKAIMRKPKRRKRGSAKYFLKQTKKTKRSRQEIQKKSRKFHEESGDLSEGYSDVIGDILPSDPSGASAESELTMTESSIPSECEDGDYSGPESDHYNESATEGTGEKQCQMATLPGTKNTKKPKKRRKKIGPKKKQHGTQVTGEEKEQGDLKTTDVGILVRHHAVLRDSMEHTDISKENLSTVANFLKDVLEENWTVAASGDVMFLSRLIFPTNPIVERSIIWKENSLIFLVHNRQLPTTHPLWQMSTLASRNCMDVADHLIAASQEFLHSEVCTGIPTHQHLWETFSENGHIETLMSLPCFRPSDCCFLVSYPGKCTSCRRFQKKLFEHDRQKARTASRGENIDRSKINNRYLQRDEIIKKMENIEQEKRMSKQAVVRLRRRVDKLIKRDAEKLDSQLGHDFVKIMNENTDKMSEMEKIFWQQQSLAISKKGKSKTMRWHPCMIRLALHLRMLSPTAFDFISGIISLPSQRRLFDFSQFTEIKEGVHADLLDQFKKSLDEKCSEDHEKYFSLLLDEMSVRSDLVYDSRSGELVGFTNLTSLEAEISTLEAEIQGKTAEKKIAKKILVFMLSGCTNTLRCVPAVYTTDSLSASQLYVRAWDVIYAVEETGAKVLVVICDGASVNRKYMRMHFNMGDKDFTYVTINSASGEERPIFFMLDPPHLIKTFRNCLANSHSHRNSRALWNNNQDLSWKAIEALFILCQKDKYKSTKLTKAHVFLTSFSCMKVFLATQVFSYSVSEALVKYKDTSPLKEAYSEELVSFIRLMNRCFDCLNGGEDSVKKNVNPDLLEYKSSSDPRFTFLVEDFLGYLEKWEHSVLNREGNYTKEQRQRMIISYQSLEGMKITINSFKAIVKFALDKGAPFVSSRRFNQDPLEQRFSDYRRARGSDNNPTVKQVLHTEISLAAQGQMTSSTKRGNTEARKREMEIDSSPLPTKKRKQN